MQHRLLYSTNSWIANRINTWYYGDKHWVYCAPFFDTERNNHTRRSTNPIKSNPASFYTNLMREAVEGRCGGDWIQENMLGLVKGAMAKRRCNAITRQEYGEVIEAIYSSRPINYLPVVYVIPNYQGRVIVPSLEDRKAGSASSGIEAAERSIEYRIEDLDGRDFDTVFGTFELVCGSVLAEAYDDDQYLSSRWYRLDDVLFGLTIDSVAVEPLAKADQGLLEEKADLERQDDIRLQLAKRSSILDLFVLDYDQTRQDRIQGKLDQLGSVLLG